MARDIIGDSYGQLFQNELGLDSARDQRYFNSLADARYRQQQADTAAFQQAQLQQAAQQQALQEASLMQSLAGRADDSNYRSRALAQQKDLNLADLTSRERIAGMGIQEQNQKLGLAMGSQLYNEAYQAITNGSVKTPTQLEALVGDHLGPDQKGRLGLYLGEAHKRRVQQYSQQVQAANNLGLDYARQVGPFEAEYAKENKLKADAPERGSGHFWNLEMFRTTKDEVPQVGTMRYNNALNQFNATLAKDKRAAGMVSQDVGTHQFVPIMEQPEDFPGLDTKPALLNAGSRAAMPPTPATPAPAGAATPSAAMPDTTAAPSWAKVPGTNIAVHPAVMEDILAKGNAIQPVPGETPTALRARQNILIQQLVRQAMSSGTARVETPPAPEYLGMFDGPGAMGSY